MMVEEYYKYRAYCLQIAGFSLFVPLGKLFIDIKEMSIKDLNIAFAIHLFISLVLCYLGVIAVDRGAQFLRGERNDR